MNQLLSTIVWLSLLLCLVAATQNDADKTPAADKTTSKTNATTAPAQKNTIGKAYGNHGSTDRYSNGGGSYGPGAYGKVGPYNQNHGEHNNGGYGGGGYSGNGYSNGGNGYGGNRYGNTVYGGGEYGGPSNGFEYSQQHYPGGGGGGYGGGNYGGGEYGGSNYADGYGYGAPHHPQPPHGNHYGDSGVYGDKRNGYGHQQHQYYGQSSYPEYGYGGSYEKNYQYDTHYCSVHGSFALAYTQKGGYDEKTYGKGNEKKEEDSYGNKGEYGQESDHHKEGYGSDRKGGEYGAQKSYYKPRFFTRQYCRYAAAASERACHFCCQVVARSSNTSPDDIVSAIFAFDPVNPTSNGAGFSDSHGSKYEQEKQEGVYDGQKSKSLYQCVCCAPKHDSYKK